MSKYAFKTVEEFEFDGDAVRVEIKPVTMRAALDLSNAADGQAASSLVKQHVVSIEGLLDAEGNAVSIDTVFSALYFSPLVLAITKALMRTGDLAEKKPA